MTERTNSIYTRVTPQEKQRIASSARRCGLSISEYIRQRCLGYTPREIPPDVYYDLCAKLDEARNGRNNAAVLSVLDELRENVIQLGRDG